MDIVLGKLAVSYSVAYSAVHLLWFVVARMTRKSESHRLRASGPAARANRAPRRGTVTSTRLHTGTPALWRARFQSVGDAYWKEWIEHALAHCAGVILDMSHESASLHWELDTATRIVGVERILILSRGQQIAGIDDRIETHNLQARRLVSMADPVSHWGADVARKLWGQAAPPVVTHPRRQIAPFFMAAPVAFTITAFWL